MCIGIQGSGNSGIDVAGKIDHALQLHDFIDNCALLSKHGADAGGGGRRRDLLLKLCDFNQVMHVPEYVYTTCPCTA